MCDDINLHVSQYADDTTFATVVTDPRTTIQNINNNLNVLSAWAERWRVTFNLIKTKFIIFHLKRRG